MPKRSSRIPSYCLHKPSGQARVIIGGEHIYLGKHGSPESWEKYQQAIADCISERKHAANLSHGNGACALSVNELILAYWQHASSYYVKNGRPTDEQAGIRAALRRLRRSYGSDRASEFGPLKLKSVRAAMIEEGLSRGVINQYVSRIRRMFRWAVENELIPVEVYQALMAVGGLRKGRTGARETPKVKPVPEEDMRATLPYLPEVVQAMVRFQRLTGCRPRDVCLIRPCDVDMSHGEAWCYRPSTHKMEHVERERRIYIGPMAQAILQPWLNRLANTYCFSPKESAEKCLAKRRGNGRSALKSSSHRQKRPRSRQRRPGDCYTRHSYRQAIERACTRAGVPPWTPNQLRHSRGTEVRKHYGLEASQTVLGHKRANVTELYAERDDALAQHIATETG